MMDRCRDCNATLKPEENVCVTCGWTREPKDQGAVARRFATFIKVCFILSGVLTVASMFFPETPSFMKCVTTTLIFALVDRSLGQMQERKKV